MEGDNTTTSLELYDTFAVDSMGDVLILRGAEIQPFLTIVQDQPVQHGGVKIDCFKKIANTILAMPVLAVGSWVAFYTKRNLGECF
eukprot:1387668-Ditylum_brightwellii.AAC.2